MNTTTMNDVQKAYDEYRYFSDCLDFRTDARLERMIYLIKGSDKLSDKISVEIRRKHPFYSTYVIDMDLCKEPSKAELQKFMEQISKLDVFGNGMLIAHKLYYSQIIEEKPSNLRSVSLIGPDYDSDYIKLMVNLNIGRHYASKVRVLKEKNASKEGISSYYKNILPFDVLILPTTDSLQGLVSAAYIYQEIKLRYETTPKVYIRCTQETAFEKDKTTRLLSQLCVDDFSFIEKSDEQTLSKIIKHQKVLFVTPQRRSLAEYAEVESLRKKYQFFARFYVVEENLQELLSAPEYRKISIYKDILSNLNAVKTSMKTVSLQKYLNDFIDSEKKSLYEITQERMLQEKALSDKVEELIEKHQAYLKHLFKI